VPAGIVIEAIQMRFLVTLTNRHTAEFEAGHLRRTAGHMYFVLVARVGICLSYSNDRLRRRSNDEH
jgi:hypothetical protein